MSSALVSRNVTVAGHRTSLRLEAELWDALADICEAEGVTLHELCTLIDQSRSRASRTSAVRTFVVAYLRRAAGEHAAARQAYAGQPRPRREPPEPLLRRSLADIQGGSRAVA